MVGRSQLGDPQTRFGLGDETALAAAYAAHGSELYRFALRSLHDVGLAQDAVQETFLRAWRAAARFDPDLSSLRVWLFAIARNVVVDSIRRHGRGSWAIVPSDGTLIEAGMAPVEDETEQVMSTWLVEEAVNRLSQNHRHVIVETYLRGRSYDEVATECGCPWAHCAAEPSTR